MYFSHSRCRTFIGVKKGKNIFLPCCQVFIFPLPPKPHKQVHHKLKINSIIIKAREVISSNMQQLTLFVFKIQNYKRRSINQVVTAAISRIRTILA